MKKHHDFPRLELISMKRWISAKRISYVVLDEADHMLSTGGRVLPRWPGGYHYPEGKDVGIFANTKLEYEKTWGGFFGIGNFMVDSCWVQILRHTFKWHYSVSRYRGLKTHRINQAFFARDMGTWVLKKNGWVVCWDLTFCVWTLTFVYLLELGFLSFRNTADGFQKAPNFWRPSFYVFKFTSICGKPQLEVIGWFTSRSYWNCFVLIDAGVAIFGGGKGWKNLQRSSRVRSPKHRGQIESEALQLTPSKIIMKPQKGAFQDERLEDPAFFRDGLVSGV